jgi:putative ABC transport system ATP-binding protein
MTSVGSGPIASLEGVSLRYPPHGDAPAVEALRKVSITIPRGGRVAIRGESGSGKSTLLNILGGLDAPTGGRVVVDDHELTLLPDRQLAAFRARTVGFVFQGFHLLPNLTARENVELPMEAVPGNGAARRERAEELLDAVGMKERADHRPHRLSGGEQQRVAIARALANRPKLVLADEPTGNLDRKSRRTIVQLLRRVNDEFGTTLVIVSHDPNVSDSCDIVHVIKRGKLARSYEPKSLTRKDPSPSDDELDAEEDESDG